MGSFDGSSDFLTFFSSFFSGRTIMDEQELEVLRLDHCDIDGCDAIAVARSGPYGASSTLYDTLTEVERDKYQSEADIIPFHVHLWANAGLTTGILLLQRWQNRGIRSVLSRALRQQFSNSFPDYEIRIDPLVPRSVIRNYLENGEVKRISAIKYAPKKDKADRKTVHDAEECPFHIEYSHVAKRGYLIDIAQKIGDFLTGEGKLESLIALPDDFPTPDTYKVDIAVAGKTKRFNLSDLGKIRAYFDVTDQLEFEGGHPTKASITLASATLMEELKGLI